MSPDSGPPTVEAADGTVPPGEASPPPLPAEAAAPAVPAQPAPAASAPPGLSVLEVRELDWDAVRSAVASPVSGERAERVIARMEERLAGGGPIGLAFEEYAAGPGDLAIRVGEDWPVGEVWFVGDLHGDLLALETALQHIDRSGGGADARIVFLGDLFDDGGHAAEVVLRVFELLLDGPMRVTVLAGNHDEALVFRDGRFLSTVLPSDFTDWLNANPDHPWAGRLGRLVARFFARAPRALFFPDGLLAAHAGVPHTDLHAALAETGDWNDPRVLQDFVWLRAHPRARKRIPNRTTRGSEFGREDFAAFCEVAARAGRPVDRMIRGHDHVEERFAVYPGWEAHPALTINTLSHRLPREVFGPYERVPVIARRVRGELPEVRRLFIPPELLREVYPEPAAAGPGEGGG
ncbi:MAG TPA: metallophosphoesterase family protein [Longimicrobiaceae bacterium]|nr:metallophosphoesterase family protein [Longimicrobiaceae bacterium]